MPVSSLTALPKLGKLAHIGSTTSLGQIECQLESLPHLHDDLAWSSHDTQRAYCDARQIQTAAKAIDHIPAANEARHMIISGRFALFDFVPAILQLAAPEVITDLYLATLGFSQENITDAMDLIDANKVQRFSLLASHYFKGTSELIYDYAVEQISARKGKARFLSLRTHAKIIALRLTDRRAVVIESSANARSCKNIEQATAIGSPACYEFHVAWMESLYGNH